jgi:hypothetical protein
MRGMPLRPTSKLGFNLRTVFAVTAIVAIVAAGPSLTRMFGLWSQLVGLLLFLLVAIIATGKWYAD